MDCSEFVSRVLAMAGVTPGVQSMNSKALLTFLSDRSKFVRSDLPRVGDIALWASHTGIVGGVGAGGTMKLIHGKGIRHLKVNGKKIAVPLLSGENYLAITPAEYQTGSHFYGYYRPIDEGGRQMTPASIFQPATPIPKQQSSIPPHTSRRQTASFDPNDAPVLGDVEVFSEPGNRQPPPLPRVPVLEVPASPLPSVFPKP